MFVQFFYMLRERGVPVTPTSFLRLQKALALGLIGSLDDFYTAARSILVKSERYFDTYDQVFAHYFKGAQIEEMEDVELTDIAKALLEEWLKHPQEMAEALGLDEKTARPAHTGGADPVLSRPAEGAEGGPPRREPLDRHGRDLPRRPFGPPSRRDARGRRLPEQVGREGGDGAAVQGLQPGGAPDGIPDGRGAQEAPADDPPRSAGRRQRGEDHHRDDAERRGDRDRLRPPPDATASR